MSTATMSKPRTRKVKVTVNAVRVALEAVALATPAYVDRRAADDLPARYVEGGRANCLVAKVLENLGYSLGILKALDAEHPVGELCAAGVRVAESRHPALKKVDGQAKALLQWVQDQQDAGRAWGRIVTDAFKPRSLWDFESRDRHKRPWLYG